MQTFFFPQWRNPKLFSAASDKKNTHKNSRIWYSDVLLFKRYRNVFILKMFARLVPLFPIHIFDSCKLQTTNVHSDAGLCQEPWAVVLSNKLLAGSSTVTSTLCQCLNLQRPDFQTVTGLQPIRLILSLLQGYVVRSASLAFSSWECLKSRWHSATVIL